MYFCISGILGVLWVFGDGVYGYKMRRGDLHRAGGCHSNDWSGSPSVVAAASG